MPPRGVPRGQDPADRGRRSGTVQNLDVEVVSDICCHVCDLLLGVDVGRPDHRQGDGVADEMQTVDVSVALQLAEVVKVEALDDEVGTVGYDESLPCVELPYPLDVGVELVALHLTSEIERTAGLQTETVARDYPWSGTPCNWSSQPRTFPITFWV